MAQRTVNEVPFNYIWKDKSWYCGEIPDNTTYDQLVKTFGKGLRKLQVDVNDTTGVFLTLIAFSKVSDSWLTPQNVSLLEMNRSNNIVFFKEAVQSSFQDEEMSDGEMED